MVHGHHLALGIIALLSAFSMGFFTFLKFHLLHGNSGGRKVELGLWRHVEAWPQRRSWSVQLCFCAVTDPGDSAVTQTPHQPEGASPVSGVCRAGVGKARCYYNTGTIIPTAGWTN